MEEIVKSAMSLMAGLLIAGLAATAGCISEKAASGVRPDWNGTIADTAPVMMPEVVVTAERPAPETGAAMMPEIVVTAPRPNKTPTASAWTGDAPKAALSPFGFELRHNAN
jgi:hypothetical protein